MTLRKIAFFCWDLSSLHYADILFVERQAKCRETAQKYQEGGSGFFAGDNCLKKLISKKLL